MRPIYFDNHSTTRVDPRVLEVMLPCFSDEYGNAASRSHAYGWVAEELVENARRQVAALIGCDAREIIFTSGATESDNLALIGAARASRDMGKHLITSNFEHKAVLDAAKALEGEGFEVTYLPVSREGLLSPEQVATALRPDTILVSIMAANNEVGTVQDIAAIGKLCHERGVLFHTDAAQAAGRLRLDVEDMHIDLMSLSAHKMYGPKGVGALYVRRRNPRVRLVPIIFGGGHERGWRSGTLNVPAIVGFGKACEIAVSEMKEENARLGALRDRLRARLEAGLSDTHLNGHPTRRLPNNLNMSFKYVEGESLLMALAREVALSSGSACTSATLEPSYVLRAMGLDDDLAHASLRFGLGRFNTEDEVDRVADLVIANVKRLRDMSPLYEDARRAQKVAG
jgi:cysteine desulfurase